MKKLSDDDNVVLSAAIAAFGPLSQLNIVVEECLELIEQLDVMLAFMQRKGKPTAGYTSADSENFLDEVADVCIVSEQFLLIYGPCAVQEYNDAYIESGMSFSEDTTPRAMASTTLHMLIKISINALKLQRSYTPDMHIKWQSAARGFGIVRYFLEQLVDYVSDGGGGHDRVNEIIDMKIRRLQTRLQEHNGGDVSTTTQVAF